jgi:hypothetical protein
MSEHNYQHGIAAEQQFEDVLEAPETTNPEELTLEKGRGRIGPVILEVLQLSKKALTPQQVHEKLPEYSDQQINAAIQNLYRKGSGKLERVRQGRSFAYSTKPEKAKQKKKGRVIAPTKLPSESLATDIAAAEVSVQETVAPVIEKSQRQSQVQVQEQQPLNVTVSMDGQFIITKNGQAITLDSEERERLLNFIRKFLD